ncbi:putative ABC transport system permease protein [Kitasatospora sp. MAP12-15]|uniref:FtsX-like permease family protein n=1 Tax=unclassified Kitasatospora TaxID=2633591 RepID=UPI0024761D43|nr:ABC transporter permease [Kitasatospora sp. MAP12-44]MDH6111514.1 putative ABC transport system permease protein [Kitasatospora sp. MAP12-44]
MTNGLARASVRFRPSSFVGSFVALLLGAAIITACGTLLQTGLTAHVAPVRYARTPVVVAASPNARITVKSGKESHAVEAALPERARVDAALVAAIAGQPGVAAALPDTAFPVQSGPGTTLPPLTGRDFSATAITGPPGAALSQGRAPGTGEVVLDAATARAAQLTVGSTVSLTAPGASGSYRISGLAAEQAGGASAWFADGAAEQLSGHPGKVDAIAVLPRTGVGAKALAQQVGQAVGPAAEVLTGDARGEVEQPGLAQGKQVLTGLGGSFGGIAAMTAVFVVMGTVALATGQRAREFALLRAIGATPRQIRRTIATEAVLLAPLAGACGVLPGLALAHWWFDQLVSRGAIPAGVSLSVGVLPVVAAVGASLLAALTSGYLASRRPARMRPGQALSAAAVPGARTGTVRTVIGALALAGGVVLATLAANLTGDTAANTALGVVMCFLLAVALLGPLLARVATGLLGLPLRAGGAAGSLAADNTRANARRLASAITPIVMVTAFCGTLIFMASTIKHVSAAQVRTGIVADQVIGSKGPGLPAGTAEQIGRLPGVDASIGVLRSGAVYRSGDTLSSATVLGISGDPAKLPRVLDLGVRTGSLSALGTSSDTVAMDASLADTLGVKVGDQAPLWLGDGTAVRPTVVATYERGLGLGQLLFPRAALAEHLAGGFDAEVLVADTPGADRAAVAAAAAKLGPVGVSVTDAAGYTAEANRDLELNSWANTVMAGVLGGFAAVAAANTLVMTVLERRREVGLLRLAGTTRRQVRGMMRWEALLVAATGLLVGGAIAWVTLVPVTRGLTGSAPYVPLGTALPLVAGTVVLSLAATALPARALLRTRPVEAGAGRA